MSDIWSCSRPPRPVPSSRPRIRTSVPSAMRTAPPASLSRALTRRRAVVEQHHRQRGQRRPGRSPPGAGSTRSNHTMPPWRPRLRLRITPRTHTSSGNGARRASRHRLAQLGDRPGGFVGVVPQGRRGAGLRQAPTLRPGVTVTARIEAAGVTVSRATVPVGRPGGRAMHTEIAPGVLQIDTLLGGWQQVTAGYLDHRRRPGAGRDRQPDVGARPARRARRAGRRAPTSWPASPSPTSTSTTPAAWATSPRRSPNATVYVHEKGARHLVDPTRLVNSAAMVYGDLLDSLYGRLDAHPGRAGPRAGGRRARSRCRRTARSPPSTRPATPSTTWRCTTRTSGLLFAGDAVGVRLPDVGRAAAGHAAARLRPRPGPHLAAAVRRAPARRHRPRPLRPGARPRSRSSTRPRARCAAGPRWPRRPGGRAATSPRRSTPRFGAELERHRPEAQREKLETLNGIHSNAAGFRRWLEKRAEAGSARSARSRTATIVW